MNFRHPIKIGFILATAAVAGCGGPQPAGAEVLMSPHNQAAAISLGPGFKVPELPVARTVDIAVVRTGAMQDWITVRYATRGQTATEGVDYRAAQGELVFEPYQERQTVSVQVLGDAVAEDDEAFAVVLSDVSGAVLAFDTAVIEIADDDAPSAPAAQPMPLPTPRPPVPTARLTVVNSGVYEYDDAGQTFLQFMVVRTGWVHSTVRVRYATADGTASAPADYGSVAGELVFLPGQVAQEIRVNVRDDGVIELPETMQLNLIDAVGAAVMLASATGTIMDDTPLEPADPTAGTEGPNPYCERLITGVGQGNAHCMVLSCATGQPVSWSGCPGAGEAQ